MIHLPRGIPVMGSALLLLLASCAASPTLSSATDITPESGSTITSPPPIVVPTTPTSSPEIPNDPPDPPKPPSPPHPTRTPGCWELELKDFFKDATSDDWKDDRYSIGKSDEIKGIGSPVNRHSEEYLELRLGNRHEKLTFSAGQDSKSKSSGAVVRIDIYANGNRVDIKTVTFHETQSFEIDVKDVNALRITAKVDEEKSAKDNYEATLVLYQVKLDC